VGTATAIAGNGGATPEALVLPEQVARWGKFGRAKLFAGGAAAALATLAPAAAGLATAADPTMDLRLDVCCDGRTFRLDNGLAGPPARGSTFIVNGKLFPGGTFAKAPTNPDSPGSIGTWICRGQFYFGLDDIAKGAVPHVATTQYYLFDDGSLLVSDGLEGGQWVLRAVIGGTGKYLAAKGICTEEEAGTNNTMIKLAPGVEVPAPNIVFNFRLV
jgi:hypothetical protein